MGIIYKDVTHGIKEDGEEAGKQDDDCFEILDEENEDTFRNKLRYGVKSAKDKEYFKELYGRDFNDEFPK